VLHRNFRPSGAVSSHEQMITNPMAGAVKNSRTSAAPVWVDVTMCGDLVIAPALQLIGHRLRARPAAPAGQRTAARLLLRQVELLWRRQIIQYILLRAVRP
jgi:hypothetical protein